MSQDDDTTKSDTTTGVAVDAAPNPENDHKENIIVSTETCQSTHNEQIENDNKMNTINTEKVNTMNDEQNTYGSVNNNSRIQDVAYSVRENMVSKATEFLINSTIKNTSMDKRINFLRSKGLTEDEIKLSIKRAAMIFNQNQQSFVPNSHQFQLPVHNNSLNFSGTVQTPYESRSWFKYIFGPIAIAATIVYTGYQIYKKYIESWLFGKRKSSVEKHLQSSAEQMCAVLLEENKNLTDNLNANVQQKRELDQIRAELKSIKSLLLNRFQFPPAPTYSSIPEWQRAKTNKPLAKPKINGQDIDSSNSLQPNTSNASQNTAAPFVSLFKSTSDVAKSISSDISSSSNVTNNVSFDVASTSNTIDGVSYLNPKTTGSVFQNVLGEDVKCLSNDSIANGTAPLESSVQNIILTNDVLETVNNDENHSMNNGLN